MRVALKPWAKPSFVENDSGVLMPAEQALYVTSEDSSVTFTYTDLGPDTDPAGVGATQLDLKAASSGGGLAGDSSYLSWVEADNPTLIDAGTDTGMSLVMASPPSWLDGSGKIIEPGIYVIGCSLQGNGPAGTNPSSVADQFAYVQNNFASTQLVPIDPLFSAGYGLNPLPTVQYTWSITAEDITDRLQIDHFTVYVPSTATDAIIAAYMYAYQIAS